MHHLDTRPADVFSEEREATHSLLQLLRQEQAHLVDADVDGLSRVTGEKAALAARMAELAKRRQRLIADAGFEATDAGMQAWLASPAVSESDLRSWNELLELAKTARELNRVNGLLISQQMGRNQTALNVLQGNPQGGGFYGPNGQSTVKLGSRRLVVG